MSGDLPEKPSETPHRRRPRYAGKYPRKFAEKYKELDPARYPDVVDRVRAAGKTPAGTHRSIMVAEILEVLAPKSGEIAVDCTLGFGGHASELLARIRPNGKLIGLDVDPLELVATEARMRSNGFAEEEFIAVQSNFAGLPKVLAAQGISAADCILADLGVSSMQIDNPARGFSMKFAGPLDMRMNPTRGISAGELIRRSSPAQLSRIFLDNADEPRAQEIADVVAGKAYESTVEFARAVAKASGRTDAEERELTVRRVFQALRIAVNEEFSALDAFLRSLPSCLAPGGRAAILTFHSGEDRRVKKAFQAALRSGEFEAIADEVIRPSKEERIANPRSTSAKLRWARKAVIH